MKKKSWILLLLMLLFLYIPSLKAEEKQTDINKVASEKAHGDEIKKAYIEMFSDRYIVSPGDVVNISVFGEPDLTQQEVLVKCDGYVNFHPIGEVKVAGYNTDQVKTILTEKLRTFFVDPIISVHISNPHSPKIYIYGAVQSPGLFQQNTGQKTLSSRYNYTPATLANAIANAGGIKYNADLENVQISNINTSITRSYNLLKLIKNGDPSQDVYLNSGDTVFIPVLSTNAQLSDEDFLLISSSSIAPKDFPVRVNGAVNKPGVHLLGSRSPGLNTAIVCSQGFTIDANIKAVKVHRITPQGTISTIVVDPCKNDLVLRPNDIINVVDKRRTALGKGVRFVDKLAGYLGRFGSAYNSWNYAFDPITEHDVHMK